MTDFHLDRLAVGLNPASKKQIRTQAVALKFTTSVLSSIVWITYSL